MKVERFKLLLCLLPMIPFGWLTWDQAMDVIHLMNLSDSKITVSGALNDGASFAGVIMMSSVIILGSIAFITGKALRWIPKIVFIGLVGLCIIAFFIGFGMNISLKENLNEKGYMECISERVLTSRYSSRTYVLDLKLCDED